MAFAEVKKVVRTLSKQALQQKEGPYTSLDISQFSQRRGLPKRIRYFPFGIFQICNHCLQSA